MLTASVMKGLNNIPNQFAVTSIEALFLMKELGLINDLIID